MRSSFFGISLPWGRETRHHRRLSPRKSKDQQDIIADYRRTLDSLHDAWAAFNEADNDCVDTAIIRVALAERELGATLKQARESGVDALPALIEGDELGLWPFNF